MRGNTSRVWHWLFWPDVCNWILSVVGPQERLQESTPAQQIPPDGALWGATGANWYVHNTATGGSKGGKMMDIFRRLQKASESLHESMADIDNAPGIVRRLEMSHSEAEIEKKKSLLSDGLRVYDIITGFK